ncbi:hypothetical protein GCM10022291_30640 [Postechiella marina]|uniref:Superfamily III holin-X n=1 Tax=Postechiella marina TaxID=943941 RepID=A0ABP8CFU4_9FLAO
MSVFESLDETTDEALNKGESFIRNTEAYYELKLFQMLTTSMALLIKFTLVGSFTLIAFILLAVALSTRIGEAYNSAAIGHLVTSLIFIGLAIFSYLIRRWIENSIIKVLSRKMFK